MSVVAAKIYDKKIVIGADSQSTSYWHNKNLTNKIYKVSSKFVIGGVGYTAHNQLMRLFCETNKPASSRERDILHFFVSYHEDMLKRDKDYMPYNSWLIVFDGKCYQVTDDLMIGKITDFDAIGSGHEFAKSALYLGHTVKEAIKVACDLTVYCGEPIEIFEVAI